MKRTRPPRVREPYWSFTKLYWHLRKELIVGHFDLFLANLFGSDEAPKLHLYMAERYVHLAELFDRRGWTKVAEPFRAEAQKHFRLSGWKDGAPPRDTPPGSAGLAMPVPEEPIFTEAVGGYHPKIPQGGSPRT